MKVNIKGIDKAKLLAALYNRALPLGMGIIHYDSKDMTIAEAKVWLKDQTYFDYLKGRVMKVDLSKDWLYVGLYNRDNGEGAAEEVIKKLRETS